MPGVTPANQRNNFFLRLEQLEQGSQANNRVRPQIFPTSAAGHNGIDSDLSTTLIRKFFDMPRPEPVDTHNGFCPSPQFIEKIARENAPILLLPEGEFNLPTDPQLYIENSRFREDVTFWDDNEFGNNTNNDSGDDFTATDVGNRNNENAFLDLNNDVRGTLGSEDAPIFYQFEPGGDGEPPTITYHIFYPYNDAPSTLGVDLNHEGDWERITYELDPVTFEPVDALLSAHEGGERVAFEDLQKNSEGRPYIFAANGSHANYPESGVYSLTAGAEDWTASDQNDDGVISQSDGVVFFDTGRDLREVTEQDWYPNNDSRGIHWGEIGEVKYSTGPYGPSEQKGPVTIEEPVTLLDILLDTPIITY